ncbi:bifunctional serine/threonine-protein kinase/formylglycine-generating enzyme family protein [Pseudoduganella albidiflava]|nr:bifunctional serine/threonine-protein kinase/formylglycine-generating enzyme family protein [Pseudoduganella albidiflava]GGY36976.1 hypothetical protein GCM10007387_19150 [Pseudoduganella albidiflava]
MSEQHSSDTERTSVAPRRVLSNALPVGTRLGEFEITGVIGQGGFGIVYLARDHVLGRDVALKEYMPAAFAGRDDTHVTILSENYAETFMLGLQSFVKEAQLLAKFDHASLVKVYRFWEANGTGYMAMPFYDAPTLKQMLKDDYHTWADEAWLKNFLGDVLDALQVLHAKQCYHRDIAPDNILMLERRKPVLLDFGAARRVIGDMTQALTVILKPGFAPIEQYGEMTNISQGPWTDLYALAAVVYYIITGKVPPAAMSRLVSDSLVPLSVTAPEGFSVPFLLALDAALSVRPEQRPQSVAQFRAMLGLPPGSDTGGSTTIAPPGAGSHGGLAGPPATGRAAATALTGAAPASRQPAGPPATEPAATGPATTGQSLPPVSIHPTSRPAAPVQDLEVTVIPTHPHGSVRRGPPAAPEEPPAPPATVPPTIMPPAMEPPASEPVQPKKRPVAFIAGGGLALLALGAALLWPRDEQLPPAVQAAAVPTAVAPPAAATPVALPVAPVPPACPLKLADGTPACPVMVAVAGGSYRMGAMPNDPNAAAEEFGAVAATLAPFEIAAREVSVQDWQLCVDDGACKAPAGGAAADGKLPVTNVSWDAARQYIGWLSDKTGTPYRLPTEAEWEHAARGGAATTFPWGDVIGEGNAHCGQCASPLPISGPAPVGSFKDSRGLHDMVGNVYEWVDSCWHGSHADAPSKPDAGESAACQKKVQKGGAFDSPEADVRPIARTWGNRADADPRVGFRLAR